ncbi:MAG: protease inhibitor I42 family protein [Kosmotogaceae bacterium]|nr:protease inhibitor I42 family protein [Kosmotogaceae bacterium]
MKKVLTAFFYIALIIASGLAFELKESDNSMSVTDLAILEIQENPSTGYLWHIFAEPTGVLRNFLEEHNTTSMMPGAPSVKGWIMTAAKEGKALLTLKLFRQWEGEKHSVDFRALTVDVTGQEKGQVNLKILMNEVTLGTTFTITLEENASTGYTWQYVVLGDGIMERSKEISVDKSEKVGAPSKVTWSFQAVGEGYSTIIFRYFRSWEGKESSVDYKAYNIFVK